MQTRVGFLLLFEGDFRKLNLTVSSVASFSAVAAVLKNGDNDVTSTYITSTLTSVGNMIITDNIGEKASMPQGNYRYFVTGTHNGRKDTWFWDILVLAKDTTLFSEIPMDDYNPLVGEIEKYEGDIISRALTVSNMEFSAATAVLNLGNEPKTSEFCSTSPVASGPVLTTGLIGGQAAIISAEYGYFMTGTYNNGEAKTTWYYKISILKKQSIL